MRALFPTRAVPGTTAGAIVGRLRVELSGRAARRQSRRSVVESRHATPIARALSDEFTSETYIATPNLVVGDLAGILRDLDPASTIQLVYVGSLLGLLSGAAFLVVRQVLFRTKLEEATKELSERARTGEASGDEYYQLGVLLMRKKLYTTALKHLESARGAWDGSDDDLAQVHNALGYAYLQLDKIDEAVDEYKVATTIKPDYTIGWNNLGDAYKRLRDYKAALDAYENALQTDGDNRVALEQVEFLRGRVRRLTK